jgi:hypothetical protein
MLLACRAVRAKTGMQKPPGGRPGLDGRGL